MFPVKPSPKIFREYDIRGIADEDLSSDSVELLGKAIGSYFMEEGATLCALGQDCRVSSPRIATALKAGLLSTGLDVVAIGKVATPMLYFATHALPTQAGIMITGSHNPGEYNGFKICLGPLALHGEAIQSLRERIEARNFVSGQGTLSFQSIEERYLREIVKNIRHPLGLKIVIDSGNGMAGNIAPELFRRLGCEVVSLFETPDGTFPNHHPDPTVLENLRTLQETVIKEGAIVGIAFDGDADRIGVVDPSGKIIYGDELLMIYAREILKTNPGATVISEVKASNRLFKDILDHGGAPIMWKTGHSLIKKKMKETGALLAGEMSGHMFFKDRYYGFDDAIYAAARLLEILSDSLSTPAELLSSVPKSFTTPELRVDCPDDIKFNVVENTRKALQQLAPQLNMQVIGIDGARIEFEDGWGLIRASNTQPILVYRFEASSQERLDEIRKLVESTVEKCLPS